MLVILGASALVHYHLRPAGLVLAASALVPIGVVHRMRISADASGVTVVNLLRRHRIPWSGISDFRMGRVASSTCLDVWTRDGLQVHSWVVTTAYPRAKVENILADLRRRLMLANGESQEDLDARAVEDALAAAGKGDYLPASTLVAENRVDAQAMAEKLIERSKHAGNRH
jgi:PH (Pleckstrin Homology) domain-containing protein